MQNKAKGENAIVTSEDVTAIFSNIEAIVNVNKTLLEGLESKYKSWNGRQTLGDLFLTLVNNK
jgi:hypothetical protein